MLPPFFNDPWHMLMLAALVVAAYFGFEAWSK